METYRAPLTPSRLNMDEEPGAVISRLLEDGDVQIIDPPPPPPPPPCSANLVRRPVRQTLQKIRANSETLADLPHNPPGLINTRQ